MKKIMLIAAIAICAISCGKKCDKKCCQEAEQPAVEVAAPAEEQPAEEQTLLERAVELGEDVAAEIQK